MAVRLCLCVRGATPLLFLSNRTAGMPSRRWEYETGCLFAASVDLLTRSDWMPILTCSPAMHLFSYDSILEVFVFRLIGCCFLSTAMELDRNGFQVVLVRLGVFGIHKWPRLSCKQAEF
jgi:hypothetical protein